MKIIITKLSLLVLACSMSGGVAATNFLLVPRQPVPELPIAVRIEDTLSSSGIRVFPHRAQVDGSTIRIEGCITQGGFAVGGAYSATVTLSPLPSGKYTIAYYRAFCADAGPNAGTTYAFRASYEMIVSESGPKPPPTASSVETVFEYHHPNFDHYFFTIDEGDQLAIETGRFVGWERIGPSALSPQPLFAFWTAADAGRQPLCRFFSAAFAPKSSHFYTADPAECELVKTNPNWIFEGVAGYIAQANPNGSCPEGVPLYRFYNNGMGGAPNHLYTLRPIIYQFPPLRFVWTFEGAVGCVPLPVSLPPPLTW